MNSAVMAPITMHEGQRGVGQLEQRRHARHHEDAGGHHGRGVDQRGDRRRAFHRVGQPDVQRKLRRLAHGADEQADADHRHQRPGMARDEFYGGSASCGALREHRWRNRACRNAASTRPMPSRKPKSPTRLTRKALRLA